MHMSAVAATKPSFVLFSRSNDDIVKARPFEGDHEKIVKKALDETCKKHPETIKALSKI